MDDDIIIAGPDGKTMAFPAGTPEDVIYNAMSRLYPKEAAGAARRARGQLPGSGQAIYGEGGSRSGAPITRAQEEYLARGGYNDAAPVGTRERPRMAAPGETANATGVTVMPWGEVVDVGSTRPWHERPMAGLNALTSAALLGGKNEIAAGIASAPALVTGGADAAKAQYGEKLRQYDESDRRLRENFPWTYYGAGAVGTAATAGVTPVVRSGSTAVKVGGNAAINAVQGAAAGFFGTDGDLATRGRNALAGAGLGGLLGGAGSALEPKPRLARPPLPQGLQSARPRDLRRGLNYVQRQTRGKPVPDAPSPEMTAAETIGERGKVALAALARREGATADALQGRLGARSLSRNDRLLDEVGGATGVPPEGAADLIEGVVKRGQRAAGPHYERAFADQEGVMSPTVEKLLARPVVKSATRRAAASLRNRDLDPEGLGLRIADDMDEWASEAGGLTQAAPTGRVNAPRPGRARAEWESRFGPEGQDLSGDAPVYGARPEPQGAVAYERQPTFEALDAVKRALDDDLAALKDGVGGWKDPGRAREIIAARKELNAELMRLAEEGNRNPAYAWAVREAGDYKSAQGAFDEARKQLFDSRITPKDFARNIGRMTAGEKIAVRAGIANRIYDDAMNGRLNPKALRTPAVRDKLRAALGSEKADALIRSFETEQEMLNFERFALPRNGSPTMALGEAAREMDADPVADAAIRAAVNAARGGVARAVVGAAGDVAQHLGDRLVTRGMSVGARDVAGNALLGSPADLRRALEAYDPQSPAGRLGMQALNHLLTRGGGRVGGMIAGRGQ
ncbi:MAG: hypothetical protein ACOY4K_00600 [Pseudomonadota bacterium]